MHVMILKPEKCVEMEQLQDCAGLPLLGIRNISKWLICHGKQHIKIMSIIVYEKYVN